MAKNLLLPKGKPAVAGPLGLMSTPFRQKGGKVKATGIGKKAKRVAEEVPMGPMPGLRK